MNPAGYSVFGLKTTQTADFQSKIGLKMDRKYKNEGFSNLKIKKSEFERFRKFSRRLGKSNSMTLSLMLDFFERFKISPEEDIGDNMVTLEKRLGKRINALIAILKSIERTQTLPTFAIVKSFLEGFGESEEAPKFVERNRQQRSLEEELEQMKKMRQ
tara:strand:- start:169 stop:642 length:474 start_codon:yes stop_codon:yes gene_type:complete